ncbi:MAG TPA: glycosyltransferase, partial [Solirubrobacterales bacterium]|nr:glycosyltransferase [Solirubrobacterales bacterium]
MNSSTDVSFDPPFQAQAGPREALVQDRPTLGAMPMARRGPGLWLLPLADFASSSAVLAATSALAGVSFVPAFPLAPLALCLIYLFLGVYGSQSARAEERGSGWPVIRFLAAIAFAWIASLLTPLGSLEQLAMWLGFVVLDSACRSLLTPYMERHNPQERWVLVGDEDVAERLRAYAPLRKYANVVGTVPPAERDPGTAGRVAALEVVERYHADRVVISSQNADDEGLLELVRAFKSIGVPVSLLPRPLDLLEAQSATPSRVGGVPLIEVEALAARGAIPYKGPDRRAIRRTKVSVVVPAMNEEHNIGQVLTELPEGLHEVILVDGNSKDNTVEAAQRAFPGIRVTTQSGRGKGDAFRTGFAAVTGNLVVMLDADGSADPAEIPRFVAALEAGADFAKGSRYMDGGGSADITRLRSLGNSVLSGTANALHGTHFTDLCYGYNAFWARCLPFISLDVPGFEVETLINLRMASAGMKITEVPSYEKERISGVSNLKTFRDGFRVLGTIFKEARRRSTLRHPRHNVGKAEVAEQ